LKDAGLAAGIGIAPAIPAEKTHNNNKAFVILFLLSGVVRRLQPIPYSYRKPREFVGTVRL